MYAKQPFPQYGLNAAVNGRLGEVYNNWGDFWGAVQTGARWISGQGQTVQQGAQQVQNAAGNLTNLTTARVNVSTVIVGAVALGVIVAVSRRQRR